MEKTFDHERAAQEDIVARPEVTGEDISAPKKPLKVSMAGGTEPEPIAPDELEVAASNVISNAIDELKVMAGMKSDRDFTILVREGLSRLFSATRVMSGSFWVPVGMIAGAGIFAFMPPALRYMASKQEKKDGAE